MQLKEHPSYPNAAKLQSLKREREGLIKDLRGSFKLIDDGQIIDVDRAA